MKHQYLVLGLMMLVGGCATQQKTQFDSNGTESLTQWEAKTQVLDKAKSKTNSLTVDFIAEKRNRLRMDVTGSFSTPVAAAVVSAGQMTYILPQQKKFYQGDSDRASLDRLLKVDIGVEDLFAILYDEPLQGWVCKKNSLGQMESCGSANGQILVSASERDGSKRTVKILTDKFEIKMNVERISPKAKDPEKVFSLKVPESYVKVN